MEDHLGEHDPNRAVFESEHEGVRPGFLGGEGGGDQPGGVSRKDTSQQERNQQARDSLRNAERAAFDDDLNNLTRSTLERAKNAEGKGFYSPSRGRTSYLPSYYSGEGKKLGEKKKGGLKNNLKMRLATGAIIAVLGVASTIFSLISFQPFSLVEQFREHFNSMQISVNIRADRFFREQMSNGRTKQPIRGTIFNKHFKITERQNEKLKIQGIEYDDTTFKDENGKKIKVLKYDDGSGNVKVVTADRKTAKKLNKIGVSKFNTDDVKFTEAVDFKLIYAENTEFFKGYNRGSVTWRGAIANWFGSNTTMFLKNNKLTRNMFQNWLKAKEAAEAQGSDPKRAAQEIMAKRAVSVEDGGVRVSQGTEEDEDGNIKPSESSEAEEGTLSRTDMNEDTVRTKLDTISSAFTGAASGACAVVGVIGAINLMVQAWEAMQIIQITTGYFEAVDKTKVGLGEDSPINELTSAINEKKRNEFYVLENTDKYGKSDNFEGTMTAKKVYTEKTAMEAEGIAALYDNGVVNTGDPSIASFNLSASAKQIMGGVSLSMDMFKGCTIARMGAAVVSAGVDIASTGACVLGVVGAAFSLGASLTACAPIIAKKAIELTAKMGIAALLGGLIAVIAPVVANMMMRDLISELGGENLGNALTSGANMYQGGVHRASGGSLSSADKYREYAMAQKQIVAENARLERAELSPFDITSKNTFLGTILTQLMSYTHANTLMSTITASNSTLSSALIGMTGSSAMAYDIAANLPSEEEYEETCPYLASIGAVGDAFCNPYVMSDLNTIEDDPADVINVVDSYGGLEEEEGADGNVVIKKDSDLAKYIRYCDNRGSSFGIADQNIANEVGDFGQLEISNSIASGAANGAIGAIPVLGDAIDIVDGGEQLANLGYISGESCVAGNNVNNTSAPDWNKAKYYQRFIEDQSLAESMGILAKSAVTAYLEDYYKENPLDNSFEGQLARYSGMSKETVSDLLDVIAYYNFVANYDASDRYAFGEPAKVVEEDTRIKFDNENLLAGGAVMPEYIVYADVRNRVFVV